MGGEGDAVGSSSIRGEKEGVANMKKEYDFSKAVQGKFYRPLDMLDIPIYLDKEVKAFLNKRTRKKDGNIEKVVNSILRKEMELLKEIEA